MDPQTHSVPANYLDLLPEELLIEISILIKDDSILYRLSEHTRNAYIKYLNFIKSGYINNFNYKSINAYLILHRYKDILVNKTGSNDIISIGNLYYQHNLEYVYESTKGNYYYVKMIKTSKGSAISDGKIFVKNNWQDFWTQLDKELRRRILIKKSLYLCKIRYALIDL